MQKISWLVLFVGISVVFVSGCKKASSDPLVGKWKIVDAKGSAADSNLGIFYIFEDGGDVEIKGSFSNKAKYKQTGNVLELNFANNIVMKAEITFEGDKKLTYKIMTSDQVFVMEKQ